jgi:hypothetical protein
MIQLTTALDMGAVDVDYTHAKIVKFALHVDERRIHVEVVHGYLDVDDWVPGKNIHDVTNKSFAISGAAYDTLVAQTSAAAGEMYYDEVARESCTSGFRQTTRSTPAPLCNHFKRETISMTQATPEQAQRYAQDVLHKLEKSPEALSSHEKRLAVKYREAANQSSQLNKDIEQLRNQIRQAEARLRSMELQLADSQGKANGLIDFLVSLKFEDDPEVQAQRPPNERPGPRDTDPKGNGKPLTRKARGGKKATKKSTKPQEASA